MWKLSEIKQNDSHKALLKLLKGQHILFLENDYTLSNSVGNLEVWLIENKIQYNTLFNVEHLPMEYIKDMIEWNNTIVFQTTWTSEHSNLLYDYISKLKRKKTIVECYICDPTWFHKPKGVVHDIYVVDSHDEDMDEWDVKKLRINKGIWEK